MKQQLNALLKSAFDEAGYPNEHYTVSPCKHPEWGDFSCSGALPAAKQHAAQPREIAAAVVKLLSDQPAFDHIRIDGPGFINLTLNNDFITSCLNDCLHKPNYGIAMQDSSTVIDYGGANVAKPLHVGHLRSAIIGESLKRMLRFRGHTVLGDTHLGDWGLPMGMLIHELSLQHPQWPYFDPENVDSFPEEAPLTIEDLEKLYPEASQKSKQDDYYLAACRQATSELQEGRPGYRALWAHFITISHQTLQKDYGRLGTTFDLWLGESDADEYIEPMIQAMIDQDLVKEDQGALIMQVAEPTDKVDIPPILLRKTDGAVLYSTTDLATLVQRVLDFSPHHVIYVVDKRQSLHFEQVFRCARKAGICPESTKLTHIPYGTMNGSDGKPFKTRDGGVLKLNDLIELMQKKALERLSEGGYAQELSPEDREQVATQVGIGALKFGDLNNTLTKDYRFDIDRFTAFEGKTGPYLQYSAVRAQSILMKANHTSEQGRINAPHTTEERALMLAMLDFTPRCEYACDQLEPMAMCEYAHHLSSAFSSFYASVPILDETDTIRRQHLLNLTCAFKRLLQTTLGLLGIEVPNRM